MPETGGFRIVAPPGPLDGDLLRSFTYVAGDARDPEMSRSLAR